MILAIKKRSLALLATTVMFAVVFLAGARAHAQNFDEVVRVDPAADAIVPQDAKVEKLAADFQFLEGPVWVHSKGQGYFLFSDIPANVIRKWDPKDGFSVFLEKSGFTGADAPNVGGQTHNGFGLVNLIGSNGITLDKQARIVFCQHGDRQISRMKRTADVRFSRAATKAKS
jgi:gluconolactonase